MKRRFAALAIAGALTLSMTAGSVAVFAESTAAGSTEAAAEENSQAADGAESKSLEGMLGGLLSDVGAALEEKAGDESKSGEGLLGAIGGLLSDAQGNGDGSGILDALGEKLGGLLGNSKELKDMLSGLLDGSKISEVTKGLKELLKGVDTSGLTEKLGGALSLLVGEDGKPDLSAITQVIGGLFGQGSGEEIDMRSLVLDELNSDSVASDPLDDAITEYIADMNKGFYDPSDVQIITPVFVSFAEGDNPNENVALGDFWQFNFDKKGDGLVFKSGGNSKGLLYYLYDPETDSFEITASELYEDEDFYDHLAEMCEITGITEQEYYDSARDAAPGLYTNLINCAKIYPEIKTFEVDGEVYTVEEAKQFLADYYTGVYKELSSAADEMLTGAEESVASEAEAAAASDASSAAESTESAAN